MERVIVHATNLEMTVFCARDPIFKVVEKAKSSKRKKEQAKGLLDVSIPQTVEMSIQQMLATKELEKKDAKEKRKELLKREKRATRHCCRA